MQTYDFDLFVIGAGSGGVRASRIAAGYGVKVAIAEEYRLGGTCVIRGCVPKKLLMYASEFRHTFEDAVGFGWEPMEGRHDWTSLIAAKDREIDRLEGIYRRLLEGAGVKIFGARATIAGPHEVAVDGQVVTAHTILIATGGAPTKPEIPGADLLFTSNQAFHLESRPDRVAVLGGGYIACEFAGIFNGLGSAVTQLYRGEQILRGFDDDSRHHLAAEMVKQGIDLRVNTDVVAVERQRHKLALHLSNGEVLEVDAAMAATGRSPNTAGLGLETVGVTVDAEGAVEVDAYSKTSNADIYAVGDVTNRLNLTPVAIAEGHSFADTLYGQRERAPDHENVPFAVFSQPPLAAVGLSEAQARQRYAEVDVYRTTFRPLRASLSGRDEKVLIKLLVDAASDRVVGAHMVGAESSEIIQGLAIAIKAGATKADFDATLGVHPTLAEEFVTLRQKVTGPGWGG